MGASGILRTALGALGLCSSLGTAQASSFNIAPIRAQLQASHRTEVLTLTNTDDQPVVVQVRVAAWSQENGEERLDDTRDVLLTPPVLQIPANGEQIVRVALRREPDPTRELTYRVIFEEVPQAAPAGFNGLRVALRLSVPVFIAPLHGKPKADVTWAFRPLPEGEVEVSALNQGTAHLQVTDFAAQLAGAAQPLRGLTAKYVLPGSRMSWVLKPESGAAVSLSPQGSLVLHGHSDQGDFTADAALSGL